MMGLIRPLALIGLLTILLVGCSDEGGTSQELTIEASALTIPFEDEDARSLTRANWPPTSYRLYDKLYDDDIYQNYKSLEGSSIDVFFTKDGNAPLHGRLKRNNAGVWKLSLSEDVTLGTPYFVYGFVPLDVADDATILPLNETYTDGAILTIKGLKSVATDPCVIIGAKKGLSADLSADGDTEPQAGEFGFTFNADASATNYLFLLFDHLYSALSIYMRVHTDYDALRTINLKELSLKPKASDGTSSSKYDATITLTKTAGGANPISSIQFAPSQDDTNSDNSVYSSTEGIFLNTSYSLFLGHFMPQGISEIEIASVYDIYDKNVTAEHPNGNLIRKNCKATNTLVLSELFDRQTESRRGYRYTINMTIQPTYLYMLSEPDLDNPTLVVEN